MSYAPIDLGAVEHVAPGFYHAEHVAFDRAGNLYGGCRDGVIRRMSPDGAVDDFAQVGGRPVGFALDRDDNLYACNTAGRCIHRITPAGEVSVFADRADGRPLYLPNFPVFDADGNLFVTISTDRDFSMELFAEERAEPKPRGRLVRFTPDGSGEVVAEGFTFANGCAIDPGEEYVYVAQSTTHDVVRVPLGGGEVEPFSRDLGDYVDGIGFDREGWLLVTLPYLNRVVVLDPGGDEHPLVDDPDGTHVTHPTNVAFGGPDFDRLYLGTIEGERIPTFPVGRPGHPPYNLR